MIDKDNLDYLSQLSAKASLHVKAKQETLEYIIEHKISDPDIAQNLLVMGQVWAAGVYNQDLNTRDLLIYLGSNRDEDVADAEHQTVELRKELRNKTLKQILDLTSSAQGPIL